jgi:hypothetical protein
MASRKLQCAASHTPSLVSSVLLTTRNCAVTVVVASSHIPNAAMECKMCILFINESVLTEWDSDATPICKLRNPAQKYRYIAGGKKILVALIALITPGSKISYFCTSKKATTSGQARRQL